MIRKQIYVREDQEQRLKALAARAGRTEADIIRAAIDLVLEQPEPVHDWKNRILQTAGMWADHAEIESIMAETRRLIDERLDLTMSRPRNDGAA